ncbi:hypothetical protein HIM_10994 [Hirsutella minnesotensis 3608]|uniref:RNA-dependent RNA polymerase n=1 Tax=Hirsutella minnesotensis 3608 TaxID=1043627 RepID=A0A0F7ZFR6_9HYPO|nr:hypothetical protein HIM_10994 [Hirsutella minnesotensis 3608]
MTRRRHRRQPAAASQATTSANGNLPSQTSSQSSGSPKAPSSRTRRRVDSPVVAPPKPPRPDYFSWPELVVRLDGLPAEVTTANLWNWFSCEGNITWMEINDKKNSQGPVSARICFEPPPRRPFLSAGSVRREHLDPRRYPNGLKIAVQPILEPPRRWRVDAASGEHSYPGKMKFGLRQIDFGSLTKPRAMAIVKTFTASPTNGHMKLELDMRNKRITVYFHVPAKELGWTGTRLFCFQVDIASITNIYQSALADGSTVWVLRLPRPPRYFWRMEDLQPAFADNAQSWNAKDLWYRATDVAQDLEMPLNYPVAIRTEVDDPEYVDIGRWTTFRLILSGNPNHEKKGAREQVRAALEEHNVPIINCQGFKFETAGKSMWDYLDRPTTSPDAHTSALMQMAAHTTHISPDVRYQLEVCVSRGVLIEHTVTAEFLETLAALRPLDATRRLEYLVDQNEPLYDPMQLFDDPDAEAFNPNIRTPHYCILMRKVVITPTTIRYSSPTVETSNRVMRKYSHLADRFLRVQFTEESEQGRIATNRMQNELVWKRVLRSLYQGIRIGDRIYEFLGFGSSQLRQCGAFFFCPTEHVTCDDIRQWMGDFTHIKTVAKYAARLGQCFSTTREIRGISQPQRQEIPDIERNGYCFTDGIGIISEFLSGRIIDEFPMDILDKPTAFQFRMGGAKGVMAVWPHVKGMTALVRDSQKKFTSKANSLEIVKCARFATATLNRQTIVVLECLGVPKRVFLRLLEKQIKEYQSAMVDNPVAIGLLTKFVDENQSTLILADLLKANFKTESYQEPFAINLLRLWRSWSLKLLKEKARIQVEKSAFVLGCVDETGSLRGHSRETEGSREKDVNKLPQIFLQLTDPARCDRTTIITGVCIVGRNPSLHPGDIRVVLAVDDPKLHHLKDVVVFPSTGDRPVPNMLAGGDLDGDDFFVFWDPDLIPTQWNFPPMDYAAPKPRTLARDVNVDDIREFFVKYLKNDCLGLIAHAHLGSADADPLGPKSQLCFLLTDLHSKAVDYPKTGEPADFGAKLQPQKWPHFMEKRNSYRSLKSLGVIYDKVVQETVDFQPDMRHAFDQRILTRYELSQVVLDKARDIKKRYDVCVRRVLTQHNVETEFELYTAWAMSAPAIGGTYKRQEDLGREYDVLKVRFRDECIEAAGSDDPEKLDPFVAAMYKVTEQDTRDVLHGRSDGPTNGDDEAMRTRKMTATPLITFPWIFHWVLIRIATGGKFKARKTPRWDAVRHSFANDPLAGKDQSAAKAGDEMSTEPISTLNGEHETPLIAITNETLKPEMASDSNSEGSQHGSTSATSLDAGPSGDEVKDEPATLLDFGVSEVNVVDATIWAPMGYGADMRELAVAVAENGTSETDSDDGSAGAIGGPVAETAMDRLASLMEFEEDEAF